MKIVHIGYPKTGTSYLQGRVFGPLSIQGFIKNYVGDNGVNKNHRKSPLNFAFTSIGKNTTTEFQMQKLNEFFSSCDQYLVSIEGILANFESGDLFEFVARLANYVPGDSEIVITIRDFASFFDSAYQQRVKGDWIETPDECFTSIGLGRRHKIRRKGVESLVKYDLDSLVDALLRKFESVVLIDVRSNAYLPWLSERIGMSADSIEKSIAAAPVTRNVLNVSLSPSSVRILERFNCFSRILFMTFGIKVDRLDDVARSGLPTSEAVKYKVRNGVIGLKSKLIAVLRLLDSLRRPQKKYQLPKDIKSELLIKVPSSNLLIETANNGGFLRITRQA